MASKASKRAAKKAARVASTIAANKAKEAEVKVEQKVEETPKPTETTTTTPKAEVKNPTTTPAAPKPAEKPAEKKPAPKTETKQETKKEDVKPQPSQSKETKQEQKKENKASKPKEGPKIPTIPAEEVKDPIPSVIKNASSFAKAVIKNEADGRIDANHSIDLMKLMEKRYLSPGAEAPEELKKAMSSQFDAMMWVNLNRWNEQTKNDFGAANLVVNEEIFAQMQQGLADVFGITLKALPNKESSKQMTIDFDASNETASKETKEAIKEAVKAPVLDELPKYEATMNEAQCVEALDLISKAAGKFTVHEKLQAMIDFTRRAWKLGDAEVSKVLSVMLSKVQNPKCFTFTCYSNIAYGGITTHISPFVTHTLVREKLKDYGYNESQIADIVRFFVTLRATNNCGDDQSELPKRLKELTSLMSVFDKKLITKMVAAWEKKKDIEIPKVTGWSYGKKEFNVAKVIESIKTSYGNLKQKDLINKLTELADLYKKEFKPIEA